MKLGKREIGFLLLFLPIFCVKFFDINADNLILKAVGIIAPFLYLLTVIDNPIPKYIVRFFSPFLLLSFIMIFTAHKQGMFLSILLIIAMYGIKSMNRVYKICFYFGVITLLVACYVQRDGFEITRYFNGIWITLTKRGNNVLGMLFFALVCLYFLIRGNKIKSIELLLVVLSGILMFFYTGTRSIVVVVNLLVLILLVLRSRLFYKKVIKRLCIFMPVIMFLISIIIGILYPYQPIIKAIDIYVQGRFYQNSQYLREFLPTLFGRDFNLDTPVNEYWCMDCSYIDMLIFKGVLWLIVWLAFNTLTIRYMYNKRRIVEVSIIVTYAIYGIMETFLPNGFINMSYFIFASYIYHCIESKRKGYWVKIKYTTRNDT